MSEASVTGFPKQLRNHFTAIITICTPSKSQSLRDKYKKNVNEDMGLRDTQRANPCINFDYTEKVLNQALTHIENKYISINSKTLLQFGQQLPNQNGQEVLDWDICIERNYNINALQTFLEDSRSLLITDQRQVYGNVLSLFQT